MPQTTEIKTPTLDDAMLSCQATANALNQKIRVNIDGLDVTFSPASDDEPAQKPAATKPKAATPTKPKRKAKAKKTKQNKYAPAGFNYLSKVKLREAKIAGHIPWLVTVNEAIAKYGMTTDFTPHAPAKVGTTKMSKRDKDDIARLKRKGLL
tara:strand:+ start:204 stop:659 length:456 start_codon:yes stop_codon:yes gene_type:complete